jgi:ubiquitin-protein ligase
MKSSNNHINTLVGMGFTKAQAENALKVNKNNLDNATDWLLSADLTNCDEGDLGMDVEGDKDFQFALRLQQEESAASNSQSGVLCGLTGKRYSGEQIYILDDCSHKFSKTHLVEYINTSVMIQVNVKCPSCTAAISVRDMKELLPKQDSGLAPKTSSKQASQRITSELKHILASSPEAQGYSVEPIKDNLYHWECKFFNFEPKELIAQDLLKLKQQAIVLHITFPSTYPFNPPFCRVIKPRFAFHTGHVTIGGSICTELLTNKGWTSANTIEAVVVSIRAQFLEGGARLDMHNKRDYTEQEAKEAFNRMVQVHGWH